MLLEWKEYWVLYGVQCCIAQDFHRGLMVCGDQQIVTAQQKHATLLHDICNSKDLAFSGRVSWFCWGCDPWPCEDETPFTCIADRSISETTSVQCSCRSTKPRPSIDQSVERQVGQYISKWQMPSCTIWTLAFLLSMKAWLSEHSQYQDLGLQKGCIEEESPMPKAT